MGFFKKFGADCWQDGDGDTSVNLTQGGGGGYIRTKLDGDPTNNLG